MKKLLLIYFSERNCCISELTLGQMQQSKEENKILYLQIFPAPKINFE